VKPYSDPKTNAALTDGIDQVLARRATTAGPTVVKESLLKDGEPVRVLLDLLDDNPDQPRQYVDPDYIEELAETILQRGLIHRVVVRQVGARFQIVAGHCRRDAYKRLRDHGAPGDWTAIPADLVQVSDEESALHCLLENIEREDLSPAEEGAAYANLMLKYGLPTAKELAARLGVDEQRVARRLRVHEGPNCIKSALTRGLKVPVADAAEGGGRKKNETRRLGLDAALEFLKLYEHHRRKHPGTEGGRPDGRPIADGKTEPVVMRALSEGWSRQRIRAQVERLMSGKPVEQDDAGDANAAPMFEIKADRFVVFTKRLARASVGEREAVLEELRKALANEGARA
jgi:ParB/RepB/Spo0J family partition protein